MSCQQLRSVLKSGVIVNLLEEPTHDTVSFGSSGGCHANDTGSYAMDRAVVLDGWSTMTLDLKQ